MLLYIANLFFTSKCTMYSIGRNDPCDCGSGKKYKKCCLPIRKPRKSFGKDFLIEVNHELDEMCDIVSNDIENRDLVSAADKLADIDRLYPHHHKVKFLQGVLAIQEDNCKEAIEYFEKAIQIFPYFSEALYNLGCVYRKTIRLHEAVTCFRQVIEYEGTSDVGLLAKKELDFLERIIKETSNISLEDYLEQEKVFNKAFSCLQKKQYEAAISLFEKVLIIEPNHVQSYGNMGIAYGMLRDRGKALECFDKALSLDPDYEVAKTNKRAFERLFNEGEIDNLEITMQDVRYYENHPEDRLKLLIAKNFV